MNVAIIGRSKALLNTAKTLVERGHHISAVWTCQAEATYGVGVSDFEKFAKQSGAPFRSDLKINTPEGIDWLRSSGAEIGISINWLTVLSENTINCLPGKILNAHAGDLPRYRGNACPNWAILNGETRVGLTIHEMSPELDAGPIVLKTYYPLTADTYIGDVYDWLEIIIPTSFVDAVSGLANDSLRAVPQPTSPGDALRCYPRRPEDARIVWSQSADMIHRLIRASSRPFDGAFSFLEGENKITIWRAELVESSSPMLAIPGQVCFRIDNDPVVACGEGLLRLTDVSTETSDDQDHVKTAIHQSLRNRLC